MPESLHTAVVPLRPGNIALHVDDRHRMLCERHGERCLGNAGAVAQLRHEKVITREQALLQRGRRNDKVLEKEEVDEIYRHEGEYDGVDPRHNKPCDAVGIAPPLPTDFLGDVYVEDEGHYEQSPPALHPKQKQQIENENDAKLRPLFPWIELGLFFINHDLSKINLVSMNIHKGKKAAHKGIRLKLEEVACGEQSLVGLGEFGSEHCTKGKAFA